MLNSVMIVDDMEEDRYIAKWSIEKGQIAPFVIEAKDGSEALDLFLNYEATRKKYGDKFPPMLILLDVNMPKMTGIEFLEKFSAEREKNPEFYNSVFVMMFTSSSLDYDKERALKYKFVKDYLVKPVTAEGLAKVIAQHF